MIRQPQNLCEVHTPPKKNSPLFEFARVLVRFDHVARFIVNANPTVMSAALKLCVQHSMRWKCKAFWMFMLKSI
jgi:hypothetical protein